MVKQAAEKRLSGGGDGAEAEEAAEKLQAQCENWVEYPSAAKAGVDFVELIGTDKSAPLQVKPGIEPLLSL